MVYNITLKPRGMEMGRLMTEGTSSFNGPTPINIAVNLVSNIDGRAMWPERLKFEHPRLCATHERRLFSEYGGRRQSKFSWSPTTSCRSCLVCPANDWYVIFRAKGASCFETGDLVARFIRSSIPSSPTLHSMKSGAHASH